MLGLWISWAWAGTMPKLELPPPMWTLEPSSVCYGSGLEVVLLHRPATGLVAITTVVGGGSSAETDATRGAAHLVEHLWFRSRPSGGPSVDELLQPGIDTDGATFRDATVFTTVGSPADLEGLLAIEVQRLVDPLQGIDAATVDSERRVLRGELAGRDVSGQRAVERLVEPALWPADHPYAHPDPTDEALGTLGLEGLRTYVTATYRPERALIQIEGDVDGQHMVDVLRRVLPDAMRQGSTPCAPERPSTEPPPDPATTELVRVEAPVWRPQLVLAWSVPAGWGADDVKTRLVLDHLRYAAYRTLPHVRGLTSLKQLQDTSVDCAYDRGLLGSEVTCTIELPQGADVPALVKGFRGAVDRSWGAGELALEELGFAESGVYRDAFGELDRFDADARIARALGTWAGRIDPVPGVVDTVFTVRAPDLTTFGGRWLSGARAVAVEIVPETVVADVVAVESVAPVDPPESPWHAVRPGLAEVAEYRLPSGLRVWIAGRPDAPYLLHGSLVLQGGWATTPWPGANEVADFGGTVSLGATSGQALWGYAADASLGFGSRSNAVDLVAPAESAELQLWLAERIAVATELDFKRIDADTDRILEVASGWFQTRPEVLVGALRMADLFPGDRLGDSWWERLKQTRTVTRGQGLKWSRSTYQAATSHLVLVGPVDRAATAATVTKRLGGWEGRGSSVAPLSAPLPPLPMRHVQTLDTPSVLAEVDLSCRIPARTDENAAALAVLDAVLERGAWRSLRVGQGAYFAGPELEFPDDRTGILILSASVAPSRDAGALDAMFDLLREIHDGASPAVVAWGRGAALRAHAQRFASAEAVRDALRESAAEGRSLEGLRAFPASVDRVDAGALADLVDDCVGHESVTVIGPTASRDVAGAAVDWATYGAKLADSLR